MAEQIIIRKDTAANWALNNPVLALGEFGLATDTKDVKIGDGVTTWNSLARGIPALDDVEIFQRMTGRIRTIGLVAGGHIHEYYDQPALDTGAIEHGFSFNATVDLVTGAWLGRDKTGPCWLMKWTDLQPTYEIWFADSATAGTVPVWQRPFAVDGLTGRTIVGALQLNSLAVAPGTPTSGSVLYNKRRGGREFPTWKDAYGIVTSVQPAIFGSSVCHWSPGNAAAVSSIGATPTIVGTASHPALAATNLQTSMNRTRFTSAATANLSAGLYSPRALVFRGNATLGGFFMFARISPVVNAAGGRMFAGVSATLTALTGDPSTTLTDSLGIGYDSADLNTGNLFLIQRTAAGVANKVDLGINAARSTTDVYDLTIFAPRGGASMFVRLVNESSGVTILDNVEYTTNLPTATTFLAPRAEVGNLNATASTFDISRLYVESDF